MRDKQPRLGVACLVISGGQVLLGRRAHGPNVDKWVLPGGGVELGESWRSAGEREYLEETRLRVTIAKGAMPFHIMEIIGDSVHAHRVVLCVEASVVHPIDPEVVKTMFGPEHFKPGDELSALQLFRPTNLPWPDISLPVTRALVDFFVQRPDAWLKGDRFASIQENFDPARLDYRGHK